MHLVEQIGRLTRQTVKLLIQIRLTDGQQTDVPTKRQTVRQDCRTGSFDSSRLSNLTRAVVASRKPMRMWFSSSLSDVPFWPDTT